MNAREIVFHKINLDEHKAITIKFRADSFMLSFGSDDAFWDKDRQGGEKYIDWLKGKDSNKFGAFHIWKESEIIGQMEIGIFQDDEAWGYIHLYYLKEKYRGKGYGRNLDDFAIKHLKSLGVNKAKLSVSPTNKKAIKFYEKNGWIDRGLRTFEGRKKHTLSNPIHFMEKFF